MATDSNLLQISRKIFFSCLVPTLLLHGLLGLRKLNAAIEDARTRSDLAGMINANDEGANAYFAASGLLNRNLAIVLAPSEIDAATCDAALSQFLRSREYQDKTIRGFAREIGFETVSCGNVKERIGPPKDGR
jgi:hypothetical protein